MKRETHPAAPDDAMTAASARRRRRARRASASMACLFALCALAPTAAMAQNAPVQLYFENFENRSNPTTTVQAITAYTGNASALNQTYNASASSFWNSGSACNGSVLSYASRNNFTACSQRLAVGELAQLMGLFHGLTGTAANNESVLAAYTSAANASGSNVELITNNLIAIAGTGQRYVTFGADTIQASCPGDPAGGGVNFGNTSPAQYNFYLVNTGGVATLLNPGGPVNACAGGTPIQPGGAGAQMWRAKRILANSPQAVAAGSSYRLRMDNITTSSIGNDGAVDNFVLFDVTPSLGKAFSPAMVEAGATASLVFTVTNTTDLLAKPGWSFTDSLPTGMTLASTVVGGTCTNPANAAGTTATLTGAVGASAIGVSGSLPATASCTVIVTVRVAATVTSPTLQNCGSNIVSPSLLNPPAPATCASLAVGRRVSLGKQWLDAASGDAVTLAVAATGATGVSNGGSTAPSTTTPASALVQIGAAVTASESFTTGSTAAYASAFVCRKASDNSPVADGQGVTSIAFAMPADSAVNCMATNRGTLTDVSITKSATPNPAVAGGQVGFTLTITNHGPAAADSVVVRDPAVTGLDCTAAGLPAPTCAATPGSTCPGPLTAAALQTGVAIPTLPAAGVVTVGMTCTVTASGLP